MDSSKSRSKRSPRPSLLKNSKIVSKLKILTKPNSSTLSKVSKPPRTIDSKSEYLEKSKSVLSKSKATNKDGSNKPKKKKNSK